jgi:lysophospholipase L1-like esterase
MHRAKRASIVFAGAIVGMWAGGVAVASPAVPLMSSVPSVSTPAVTYYVALGDSLSQGVMPNAQGHDVQTTHGYVDDLYAMELPFRPNLRMVKLGCPGESTLTMMQGGICPYPLGSQLAQAESFFLAHPGQVAFVTMNVGGNDIYGCADGGVVRQLCVRRALRMVDQNLPQILAGLRGALGQGVPIVGASYYDAFLAAWLSGPSGEMFARQTDEMIVQLNELLLTLYTNAQLPVANVRDTFATTDFVDLVPMPPFGLVPQNVFDICAWTWMCARAPRGPNIHANPDGYEQIAVAFETALTG